jgi:non-specific protein-tyrosine kinase
VLLVDANEEAGELSQLLGIDGSPGLAELLENPQLATDRLVMTRPRGPAVLSRGQNARVDLVDPDTATQLVQRLTREYEIVFFTGAPIQLSGNVLVWARCTEAVLVAVERDRAKRDDVAYALENLAAVHASVVGTVLLDRAPRPRRDRGQSGSRGTAAARPAAAPAATRNTRYAAVPSTWASIPEAAPVPRRSDQVGR